jgi:undecaprenyl diphosphate synthase
MKEATLNPDRLPRHVGIIMDGNGRWARKNKLKIAMGHRAGTEALREIIRNSSDIGIEALSLYAFSTENWARPKPEVDALMSLLLEFFRSEIDELHQKNVRIRILGRRTPCPPSSAGVIAAETRTFDNTGLKLNIAINSAAVRNWRARRGCWRGRWPRASACRIPWTRRRWPAFCIPRASRMWIC